MGGTGASLETALVYSRVVFGGAVIYWLLNTLASIVRGTGTMTLPAAVTTGSAMLYLGLAPSARRRDLHHARAHGQLPHARPDGATAATGRLVKEGRTVGLVECDVHDNKDRLVARASSTCMTLRGEQGEGR